MGCTRKRCAFQCCIALREQHNIVACAFVIGELCFVREAGKLLGAHGFKLVAMDG